MTVVRNTGPACTVCTATGTVAHVAAGATLDTDGGTAWNLVNGWALVSGGPLPARSPLFDPWRFADLPPGLWRQ